ncbi:uncharacterized protein MYCFIDRAFT_193837 [Pseudocercospora fijiensis CIRAD86]|uniref:Uncharacterized protein n=1 Tax=Pseudocercospora fijiensis (strain CIRAD86) TaxID=383855 RepID=M3A388_PSEFD|nr:uncharacterized protein MYCFIDRAFT_193837 [Pseudocercospora fijiensis CIRAD86]EME85559.1 hypothetical protein MYCFIDRAFT_193837 [Pseudocercospora fijiensis CIRAD86]
MLTMESVPPRYDSLLGTTVSLGPLAETSIWQPHYSNKPDPDPTTTLSGMSLFDHVHERFRGGILLLDNLLRFIEGSGPSHCNDYRKGIDSLLGSLVNMAKWLVGFLESAKAEQKDAPWTKSAMRGLRVDLHKYSSKVMRITSLLGKPRATKAEEYNV